MADLASRIKHLRISRGLTQDEFGKCFGIVKSTVSLYESGKSTPNDQIKKQICDYFNVSMDYLMGFSDIYTKNEDKEKFLEIFDELNSDNRIILMGEALKLLKEQKQEDAVAADETLKKVK